MDTAFGSRWGVKLRKTGKLIAEWIPMTQKKAEEYAEHLNQVTKGRDYIAVEKVKRE